MMIGCNSYRLYNSWRVVNVIVNVFGMGMIIYSLWLLKMWIQGVDRLPAPNELPRPWFIHVCLGVGIIVCMSTLSGHMVANCISKSVLGVYIVSIFSLLLIQVGMIVAVLFRINWDGEIMRYIDGRHNKFKEFSSLPHSHLSLDFNFSSCGSDQCYCACCYCLGSRRRACYSQPDFGPV
ncbi:tetraspanin-18-like [Actinidia eriantha]|uniref:tetraspanin-18-like n=1 Tax=Actinidia eriantha TaxID=165200 RepID=UPI002589D3BB|nr:tetraspanin-18-like [Actinidia eriantha]